MRATYKPAMRCTKMNIKAFKATIALLGFSTLLLLWLQVFCTALAKIETVIDLLQTVIVELIMQT